MDKPELIIPVRFDYKNAAQELKKVEQGRRQIGDTTAKDLQDTSSTAKGFGNELRKPIHPQVDLGALNQAAGTISDPFQQTLDYIKGVSQEFTELHRVAALKGQGDTSEFTPAEVQEAVSLGLSPKEWRKAQAEFQARVGTHFEGSQAGLSQQQLQTYRQQIVEFAKARGIAPDEAMGGNLLQFSEGPQDVNQLPDRYGRVLQTLESAPAPASHLLPQLNRVMSRGFSPEEEAQAQATMSEAMPGDEEVGIENIFKALTNARLQEKGTDLGIQEGIAPIQPIGPALQTLRQREANDENLDPLMKDYAPTLPERRGLLGFMNHGTGTGGFEPLRGPELETTPDFVEQPIRKNRDSAAGQSVHERTQSALGKTQQEYRFRTMEQLHLEAERQLMEGGRLTELDWNPGVGELVPGVANSLGQVDNFRAPFEVRGRLGESMTAGGEAASLGTVAMTARLQELLERIAHSNERMARQAEDRPLAVPPPNPPGRM
jgi:hypothetical protein